MIEAIELNCGDAQASENLCLKGKKGVTILVGPNNSGKSSLLRTIYESLGTDHVYGLSALEKVRLSPFEKSILEDHPDFKEKTLNDFVKVGGTEVTIEQWIEKLSNDGLWKSHWGHIFRKPLRIWMDGTKRLSMLPSENHVSLSFPSSDLAKLLTDDPRRLDFQNTVFDGIGHFPFVDRVSVYGSLRLAFSVDRPSPEVERGVDETLIEFVRNSLDRESVSDGFNAYVGMIGTVFASDYKCIFIDEPEAFLHPALARTLGKQLAQRSQERQIFVASHSADFVMGAIESGVPVRIVRLQFQDRFSTACLLEQEELSQFMSDPLLRSANVLSGLFAKSVIVGEADTDRAFYQEINTRLLSAKDRRGVENAVFLNAQNKQTVPTIVGLLRKMGVPAVGLVDLDVLAEGNKPWDHQLKACGVPKALRNTLRTSRSDVFKTLEAVSTDNEKKDYKRRGGISLLGKDDQEAADHLLNTLAEYGLFVVRDGEVECWLSNLKINRAKHTWLREIFTKLGSDPLDEQYVHPGKGDVWDFIGKSNSWLKRINRKGMSV